MDEGSEDRQTANRALSCLQRFANDRQYATPQRNTSNTHKHNGSFVRTHIMMMSGAMMLSATESPSVASTSERRLAAEFDLVEQASVMYG